MQRKYPIVEDGPVSEMAIVDTFTKLIFGDVENLSDRERLIIQGFRAIDENVLRDGLREMGGYLRNLGVREMIHLVSRLRECLEDGMEGLVAAAELPGSARHPSAGSSRRPN